MSLPHVLGTTIESVPRRVPYLRAAGRSLDLGPAPVARPRLRVGLVWAGSPTHQNDRHRSCSLRNLGPLFEVPGIAYYSLQVGPQATDMMDQGIWSGQAR